MSPWRSPWLPPSMAVLLRNADPLAIVPLTGQVRRTTDSPWPTGKVLMKRSPLSPGAKSLQRGSTFPHKPPKPAKRRPISPASDEQRLKVAGRACVVCASGPCHPAHLIDRSLCSNGADDPRAVVPLCPVHHRAYDDETLSILEFLEPMWRVELAFAVERVGLLSTLRRVTGERYVPEGSA